MEAFRIDHLTFSYPHQAVPALRDICLTIGQGDFFVLCGPSGSGKSTLLRQLKPAISPHGERKGEILFRGASVYDLDAPSAAALIGFVFQSPEAQIVTDKVWHELAFGLESLGCDTQTIRRRCSEMAAFFGIEKWYHRNVSELSGGQKQLLSLAAVMTMQPEILILDEPSAQLDPIAASEFISALGKINRELGTTIILSEHRLEDAFALANQAAVMENGEIRYCGTPQEIGKYLKNTGSSMFSAMPCAMRLWGSTQTSLPCPITVNQGRRFLEAYFEDHPVCPLRAKAESQPAGEERVRLSEVWFRYERELPDVVKSLDLTAQSGELFCILGGNGSGKTTMLKLISGIKKPFRGEVKTLGRVGMLPQNPKTVFVKKTVLEDLTDILKARAISEEQQKEELQQAISLCKIGGLLTRHPYDLSGGEQQRAALAKLLLTSPDILLLDEPTKGLDIPFQEAFAEILTDLKKKGVCLIMVSHDIQFCAKHADRCGMFFDGSLVTVAEPAVFFAGNSFYTTAANRIARQVEPKAVTTEDVITLMGGSLPKPPKISEQQPKSPPLPKQAPKKLPLWRKISGFISAILALCVLIYCLQAENLTLLMERNGHFSNGTGGLLLCGLLLLLLALTGIFWGRRPPRKQRAERRQRLPKRTVVASVMALLFIPLTLYFGLIYLEKKQYYITALLVLVECMLPFFLIFEGRKPKARELVIIATLCAMAIAGRAAFFMLPQFKPVMAITILAGVAFGAEAGFLVGSVTMLVSNMLFSQGPWTPWQMFAMGLIGFLAGVLFFGAFPVRSRLSLSIFGALCAIVIYGGIMNPASALIWGGETLNLKILLSCYVTGFPMDAVHGAATALFLWFGAEPMLEKLDRVKAKYGLIR